MTAYTLRANVIDHGSITVSGLNGIGVIFGFIFYVLASSVFGAEIAVTLIASLLLHEMGQVLAYRMLGHSQAKFRLVMLQYNQPISAQPLTNDGEEFFTAIMGAVFSLGPMVLSLAIAAALLPVAPVTAHQFWLFGVTCGALNFVSLLPFWPFAGGRCIRTSVVKFWPGLGPMMTVFLSAAMLVASLRTGSVALMVLAGIGAQSLWRPSPSGLEPMEPETGLIALSAYAFTLAAHFSAGWLLFLVYI